MKRRRVRDLREYLAPVSHGAVEVEKNKVRPRRTHAAAEDMPPVQVVYQCDAVCDVGQRVAEARGLQRLGRLQTGLGVVVRHDDDRGPGSSPESAGTESS